MAPSGTAEICRLDTELDRLVAQPAPDLTSLLRIGTDVAGALLVAAGDNPQRLRSEPASACNARWLVRSTTVWPSPRSATPDARRVATTAVTVT